MRVAISGASGLIGTALSARLREEGHEVAPLVRRLAGSGEIGWDPQGGAVDRDALAACDAVAHLAGEPIVAPRWTAGKKHRIRESRVQGTQTLARALAETEDGPGVLVTASGINYYGDRGDEVLPEDAGSGEGFLLSPDGGLLKLQLPVFKAALGARIGSGQQWQAWVALSDVVGIYHHALTTDGVSGPLNATAPEPVTNATFTRTLAGVLGRPAPLAVPAFAPRFALGQVANELLLLSARVVPEATRNAGYEFDHAQLESALRAMLGR